MIAIITAPIHTVPFGSLFYTDWLMFHSTDAAVGTGFLLGNMNVWGTKQLIFTHTLNKNKTFFCFKWALAAKIFWRNQIKSCLLQSWWPRMAKGWVHKWLWSSGQTLAFKRCLYWQAVYMRMWRAMLKIISLKSSVCDRLNSLRIKSPHLLRNPEQNWPSSRWCVILSSGFERVQWLPLKKQIPLW